jgi:hypothetical protein
MKAALVRIALVLVLCLTLPGLAAGQTEDDYQDAISFTLAAQGTSDTVQHFVVRPSASQEIPPTTSDAGGIFTLQFNRDLSKARYNLTVFNGTGVTQAHLHCGPAGSAGPIVVFLFGFVAEGVDVNGSLISGELTNADIMPQDPPLDVCGVTINNLSSLLAAIRQDRVYVNIHTLANPPGELRGQIFPD